MKRKLTVMILTLVTLLALRTTTTNAYWISDSYCRQMYQYCCYELRCTDSGCYEVELYCYTI